ncbi:hypothetical protein PHLGIDRAFT_118579 [Phlebiopsis gigantea 11061_1 CR5-6]|uniref:Uncharacterized protein n=1 Tax=Phlebiopsis gigantea (strain 11061_1 CR5-6) TaxID=745531 RepID=A0A0C3RY16_PHLG1|nr:hypothetical protein PHLGIDRAFT_118579 [Phlebiopsis gigantea 11061_1 CR5-6]
MRAVSLLLTLASAPINKPIKSNKSLSRFTNPLAGLLITRACQSGDGLCSNTRDADKLVNGATQVAAVPIPTLAASRIAVARRSLRVAKVVDAVLQASGYTCLVSGGGQQCQAPGSTNTQSTPLATVTPIPTPKPSPTVDHTTSTGGTAGTPSLVPTDVPTDTFTDAPTDSPTFTTYPLNTISK